jgi:hypothetical protein
MALREKTVPSKFIDVSVVFLFIDAAIAFAPSAPTRLPACHTHQHGMCSASKVGAHEIKRFTKIVMQKKE